MSMVGTQMDNGILKGDWGDDIMQGLGFHVKQYDDAIKFALIEQVEAQSKGFSFVLNGHSLGGGLATAAAAVTGAPAAIYNAAGLHPLSLVHAGYGSAIPNIGKNVVSHSVGFEALTTGQHLLNYIAPTAGASNNYIYAPDVRSWKDFNPIELHRPDATFRSIN